MSLSNVLASALELSPADRATLLSALRAADAGLDLEPSSVRASSDADVRALCGRAAPSNPRVLAVKAMAREALGISTPTPTLRAVPSTDFVVTPRHLELLADATARLNAMVGTRITAG